jgi:hypothetical protein
MFSGNGPSNGPKPEGEELKLPPHESVSATPAKVSGALGKGGDTALRSGQLPREIENLRREYEQKFGGSLQDSRQGALELLARLEVELRIGVAEVKESQAEGLPSFSADSLRNAVSVLMNFYEHTEQHHRQVDMVTASWGELCQLAMHHQATGGADTSVRVDEATARYRREVAKLTPEVILQLSIDDAVARERLLSRAMKEFGNSERANAT